jgi:flagellar basal body rod protein FlgB
MSSSAVPVIEQLAAAMSMRSLQNQVIASNIANRDTQGYQRLKLQFERAMDPPGMARVTAEPSTPTPVSVEQDLVALAANAGQYTAMARVLSRYFQIITAITTSSRG